MRSLSRRRPCTYGTQPTPGTTISSTGHMRSAAIWHGRLGLTAITSESRRLRRIARHPLCRASCLSRIVRPTAAWKQPHMSSARIHLPWYASDCALLTIRAWARPCAPWMRCCAWSYRVGPHGDGIRATLTVSTTMAQRSTDAAWGGRGRCSSESGRITNWQRGDVIRRRHCFE